MYEHKALFADTFPSPKQLDEFAADGWEMFLLVPDGQRFLVYLRRMKKAS